MRKLAALLLLTGCSDYDLHRPDPKEGGSEPEDTGVPDEPTPDPDIEVDRDSIDFGGLAKECPSAPELFTITNVGEGTLVVDSFDWGGTGSSAYTVSGVILPFSLEQDQSVDVQVVFEPNAWVSFEPTLKIQSNDPDEPTVGVELAGYGAEDAVYEQSFEQDFHEKLDVVWIIDNSGSMSDDLRTVAANFESFITVFAELDTDWQIAVITTDMDLPADSGRIQGAIITPDMADPVGEFVRQVDQGSKGSATEVGFEALQAALTDPLLSGFNAGIMREDAALAAVVISDEDDSSFTSADSFNTWFSSLKTEPELTTFSAICEDFFISCYKYGEAADLTGGIVGDIASTDYITVLENISRASAGLTVSFDLDNEPSDLSRVVVMVEDRVISQDSTNGWTYDSRDVAIRFWGDAIPEPGETGTVEYPVATECLSE
ncbi:MAG: choice-of-anchor D domain-containing protein [Alphaproteobacteria bacterium]|nr:choice-of-anchor D domain-containing protein [Alphaproteobacteria bacterium]